jgi:UDP-N-acetylglucosamine 2-epimerase (non-hydrolysing)
VGAWSDERQTVVLSAITRADGLRLAPLLLALEQRRMFRHVVICPTTADERDDVFAQLGVEARLRRVAAGDGTPAERTAHMLMAFERVVLEEGADVAVVTGDGDEALACALAAVKAGVLVARLGAGLRARDWSAPGEVNRVLTDRLGDTLLTDCAEAEDNLRAEGIAETRIHPVGNIVVDALRRCQPLARVRAAWRMLGLNEGEYVLVLLETWCDRRRDDRLEDLADALATMSRHAPVVLPLTLTQQAQLAVGAVRAMGGGVIVVQRPGFLDVLSLELGAGAIVTDAGAVQDEASALEIPCFTLGDCTERTATLTHGTNVLLGDDPAGLAEVRWYDRPAVATAIPLWDGHAAERAADVLVTNYALRR